MLDKICENIYLSSLQESRVLARRHLDSEQEKIEICNYLKSFFDNQDVELSHTEKNEDFIDFDKYSDHDVWNMFYKNITPENLAAVCADDHHRSRDVYIFTMWDDHKNPAYGKCEVHNGTLIIMSFHARYGQFFIDYSIAEDYQDNSFMEWWADKLVQIIGKNKHVPVSVIKVNGQHVVLKFKFKKEIDPTGIYYLIRSNLPGGIVCFIPKDSINVHNDTVSFNVEFPKEAFKRPKRN